MGLMGCKYTQVLKGKEAGSEAVVLGRGRICLRSWGLGGGGFSNVWRCFWLTQLAGSATGSWWVEVRDVAKQPKMHRTAPVLKVNSAEVEKPIVSKVSKSITQSSLIQKKP